MTTRIRFFASLATLLSLSCSKAGSTPSLPSAERDAPPVEAVVPSGEPSESPRALEPLPDLEPPELPSLPECGAEARERLKSCGVQTYNSYCGDGKVPDAHFEFDPSSQASQQCDLGEVVSCLKEVESPRLELTIRNVQQTHLKYLPWIGEDLCALSLKKGRGEAQLSDLSSLAHLSKLRTLNVHVDEAGIEPLRYLSHLSSLTVEGAVRATHGVAYLNQLKVLHLGRVDDIELEHIGGLSELTMLRIDSSPRLTSLSALLGLKELQTFALSGAPSLTDYSVLQNWTKLRTLELRNTGFSDLEVLANHSELSTLDFSGSTLSSLEGIEDLNGVVSLSIAETSVRDLAPLSSLKKLRDLVLAKTAVTDLSPIATSTELLELDLSDTQVRDLAALQALVRLEKLTMSRTLVDDLTPLASATQLRHLIIRDAKIINLGPLEGHPSLGTIDVRGAGMVQNADGLYAANVEILQ